MSPSSHIEITPRPGFIDEMRAQGGDINRYMAERAQQALQIARQTVPVGKTGKLARSMSVRPLGNAVWELVADVPYASFVHDGTAPHEIVPTVARVLAWQDAAGDWVFAMRVHHPGTRGQPWLLRAARLALEH